MCYLRSSVWHLAVIIIVPEKEVDPGVPRPIDEVCLAVTKHSLLTRLSTVYSPHMGGLDSQPAACPPL